MSAIIRDRVRKQLHEAEGYLMLELPRHALAILESRPEWSGMQFEACFLKGEALRSLERYREALQPLETAASLRPGDTGVALALGWCYKRTNRLAQAIDALDRAPPARSRERLAPLQPGLLLEPGGEHRQGARGALRRRFASIPSSATSSPPSVISTIFEATPPSIVLLVDSAASK